MTSDSGRLVCGTVCLRIIISVGHTVSITKVEFGSNLNNCGMETRKGYAIL
jgi:hypothetical protein